MSTHGDGGKGSARRKEDVSKIHENWDRIFGRKSAGKKEEETPMEHDDDYEDECSNDERHEDEEEWTCDVCGGPMYSAPHWKYGQCDDCGARQELINDDY